MPSPGSRYITHKLYPVFLETWIKSLDCYEGTGGFLDPTRPYLIPHPREFNDHSIKDKETDSYRVNPNPTSPSPKLQMRRKLARYENIYAMIADTIVGSLFNEAPARGFSETKQNAFVRAFWKDADGMGSDIDAVMQDAWIKAAVFGHVFCLVDRGNDEDAQTAADQRPPRIVQYTPIDILDWLEDTRGQLVEIKLLETKPRESLDQIERPSDRQVRVVGTEKATLYDYRGKVIEEVTHGFGRLPGAMLYGRRRTMLKTVGRSVMGDPSNYIDLYNLSSEERELLRNQTFAMLNVPLGTGQGEERMSVSEAQAMIGSQSGTANVLFTPVAANYISPQSSNIEAYNLAQDRLARMIYRIVTLPWESDSKDAEAAGSHAFKRRELHNTLLKFAEELQRTENTILDLVYAAEVGPDRAEAQRETDGASVEYPKRFDPPDLEKVANDAAAMLGLDLGETATREIKKQTAGVRLGHLPAETLAQINAEIDAMKVETAEDRRKAMLEQMTERLGGDPQDGDAPPEPPTPPDLAE